jgi:hypothetical protein
VRRACAEAVAKATTSAFERARPKRGTTVCGPRRVQARRAMAASKVRT